MWIRKIKKKHLTGNWWTHSHDVSVFDIFSLFICSSHIFSSLKFNRAAYVCIMKLSARRYRYLSLSSPIFLFSLWGGSSLLPALYFNTSTLTSFYLPWKLLHLIQELRHFFSLHKLVSQPKRVPLSKRSKRLLFTTVPKKRRNAAIGQKTLNEDSQFQ